MFNLEDAISSGGENVGMLQGIQHAMSGNAEDYINDPSFEAAWAIKCYDNARTHMSLICSCDPKYLKMSNCDDLIYETFRRSFPDFPLEHLNEEDLKSPTAKQKWRIFAEQFKEIVDHYNEGFLLRIACSGNYDSENTILVVKIQFLAVEIARNREGFNSNLRKRFTADDMPPE